MVEYGMHLTLIYRGQLNTSKKGDVSKRKHLIRLRLHRQLARAIQFHPELVRLNELYGAQDVFELFANDKPKDQGVFKFKALAGQKYRHPPDNKLYSATVDLHITLLRPERPGAIISETADIDNGLKMLFDALQIPDENQAEQLKGLTMETPTPTFCLLADDRQITRVNVDTDRLLDVDHDSKVAVVIIKAEITETRIQ